MIAGGIFLLFLLLTIGGCLLLLALVRSEAKDQQRMDRTSAERAARRDTEEDERNRGWE